MMMRGMGGYLFTLHQAVFSAGVDQDWCMLHKAVCSGCCRYPPQFVILGVRSDSAVDGFLWPNKGENDDFSAGKKEVQKPPCDIVFQ